MLHSIAVDHFTAFNQKVLCNTWSKLCSLLLCAGCGKQEEKQTRLREQEEEELEELSLKRQQELKEWTNKTVRIRLRSASCLSFLLVVQWIRSANVHKFIEYNVFYVLQAQLD